MNGDPSKIEPGPLTFMVETEIIFVDGCRPFVVQTHVPVSGLYNDDPDPVQVVVDERVEPLGTLEGNFHFGGITSADDGNLT